MTMHYSSIAKSFNRAVHTYNSASFLQKIVCNEMVSFCASSLKNAKKILDLGCGTGLLHDVLCQQFFPTDILGVDIAESMCHKYHHNNNQQSVCADAKLLPFTDACVDMVCSSLMLQWVQDLQMVCHEVYRVLEPGGDFVCAVTVDGTLHELKTMYQNLNQPVTTLDFYRSDRVLEAYQEAGFIIQNSYVSAMSFYYPNVLSLIRSLRFVGATASPQPIVLKNKEFFFNLEKVYRRYYTANQGIYASWNILFVKGTI